MDPRFIAIETVPNRTPFGLDSLRRSYKTSLNAADAIAAAPDVGDADDSFPKMFLMPVSTPESAESATRIDLVYMGCLRTDGGGAPILPDSKHDAQDAVQSASSSRSNDGRVATSPLTLQFYAPSTVLTYYSFGGPGTSFASDPTDDAKLISLTIGDTALSISTGSLLGVVNAFFMLQIIETHQSQEIVPGQYWLNTSRKTKAYVPYIFVTTAGVYLSLAATGSGYNVGNGLVVSAAGQSAGVTVTAVGVSNSITNWSVGSNTFTAAHNMVPAVGGSGSGAAFNVFVVT